MTDSTAVDIETAPLSVLFELLTAEHPADRADAACALGDRLRTRELAALDSATQGRLVELLRDNVPTVRVEAAITLAEARDATALTVLLAAVRSSVFRLDAIRALGRLGDMRAAPPLAALLGRWLMPWADKLQAGAALCALGDPRGASYLEGKLVSSREPERAAAIHFVGESRHPNALAILIGILEDERDPMRDTAARSLGILGDERARSALVAARTNANEELRQDIDEALGRLGGGR